MPGKSAASASSAGARWEQEWAGQVRSPEDMVRFIDDVGCCTANPLAGHPGFPSQSTVVAPGSPDVWFWKDDLHVEKRLYYTRVFGGETGFLSMAMLPAFVATNGMAMDELLYLGVLTPEAQQIYAAIEAQGPIPIRDLKRTLTPDAARSSSRELQVLERRFIITKTAITGRTRGTYGYVWDLTERWMPDVLQAADRLGREPARARIRELLEGFGIRAGSKFCEKVLGWDEREA